MLTVDSDNISHDSYYVKSSDTDLYFQATIPFYFSLMQEMGGGHASEMGIGIEDLYRDYKYTWVISRTRVSFARHAKWREKVDLESWAQPNVRLHCPRVINCYADGETVFSAMTLWAIVDMVRKRPVRPQQISFENYIGRRPDRYMPTDIGQLPAWDEVEKTEILPSYEAVPHFYDVDVNKHINNVVYVQWVIASLGMDFLTEHEIALMDVKWEKQTYAGDDLVVEAALIKKEGEDCTFVHRIRNNAGASVFSAITEWRDRQDRTRLLSEEL